MLKHIYRIIILIAVFIASIYYFSRDIKEVVFRINNTTVMADATFPLVTVQIEGEEINLLHGYSSNLAANTIWEGIVPLTEDQAFEVLINQEGYDIRKLNYELREFEENTLIESDSVSVFDVIDGKKTAKVKLKASLDLDRDYALKITLISSESKKIYYYQRVRRCDSPKVKEKLTFVRDFHQALTDKENAGWIKDRLEPDHKKENTTLAKVDIHSSFDLVTWGNITPVFLTEIVPTVLEINTNFASVLLEYIIEADISGAKELYRIKEFYRVQHTNNKSYLLNYERSMEAFLQADHASISMNQLKLGITSELEIPHLTSSDNRKLVFVRNNELWYYDLNENQMTKIFSFRQKKTDYIRDAYDQHNIQILNMDAEGNIDFLVYGYMNRGEYEGKVALILYQYIQAENRVEEMVYIPVEESYQMLKEKMGDLAYVNDKEEFYFHIYDTIYSYSMITKQLQTLAEGITKEQVVFFRNKGFVAWQGNSNPALSKEINILYLDTGERETIRTRAGYGIMLLGSIDYNLIYGFVKQADIATAIDGSRIIPITMIEIADLDKNVLKTYRRDGYYVTKIAVKDNIIELERVQKSGDTSGVNYISASQDFIMNQIKKVTPFLTVTSRVTELALTEYYVGMPSWFEMKNMPGVQDTVNTVISEDTTLRLPSYGDRKRLYYAYSEGRVAGVFSEAAQAVKLVKEKTGMIVDRDWNVLWEQGIRGSKSIIPGYDNLKPDKTDKTLESCISLLLQKQGKGLNINQIDLRIQSAYDLIGDRGLYPIRLSGVTLEDVLYPIVKGRPVIAMTDERNAVLIYGFDTFNIMVVDPKEGRTRKIGLQDSKELFEQAGNIYISILNK